MPLRHVLIAKVSGLILVTAAIFLFLAALNGGGSLHVGTDAKTNLCGPLGENMIVFFWRWVGSYATMGVVFAIGGAGLILWNDKKLRFIYLRILGGVLLCLSLSIFESFIFQGGGYRGPFPAGGYFGLAMGDFALETVGYWGSFLAIGVGFIVALTLATDVLFAPKQSYVIKTAGKGISAAGNVARKSKSLMGRIASLKPSIGPPAEEPAAEEEEYEEEEVEYEEEEVPEEAEEVEYEEEAEEAPDPAPPKKRGKPPKLKIHDPVAMARQKNKKKGVGTRKRGDYKLPKLNLLTRSEQKSSKVDTNTLKNTAMKIEQTLQSFKIDGHVVEIQRGPVITQYEVLLAAGIKVHRITNLANELAMNLKARKIRIVAPIPGKNTVGIEVPNRTREVVYLRELLETHEATASRCELPIFIGKDGAGNPISSDLTLMPHLLIAGATGSGKSVALNSVITTFLMMRSPEELKMILIDPKMVELTSFADLPHLLCPVVTDMKKTPASLSWLVNKMEERYEILSQVRVRNIASFNRLSKKKIMDKIKGSLSDEEIEKFPMFLPYIVLIVDELADLMMTGGKEIEGHIIRLAQKSRAVGIHVILATQRPSVDVITGLIKSNMPCRMSFSVSSKVDSRTILDRNGAETLLGQGDLLFLPPGTSDLRRAQSCYVSDDDIHSVVNYVKSKAEPEYDDELEGGFSADGIAPEDRDELYDQAVRIILESQRGSATLLQRRLEIGYTRASRLIDMMSDQGILGPHKGSKAREVYYTLEDWENM